MFDLLTGLRQNLGHTTIVNSKRIFLTPFLRFPCTISRKKNCSRVGKNMDEQRDSATKENRTKKANEME